jgi:tRNA (mo5U34)-methyltransferase
MAAQGNGWSPQPPPPAPAGFSFEREFPGQHWHQRWELFKGVYTPGRNEVAYLADVAGVPRDLRGLRVLDVGAWHGCFSFECERRGAREVVALTAEEEQHSGFSRLARAAGSRVVRQVHGTAYHLDPRELGHFDLVLFFGVLYHLRYPLLAIDNLRKVCRGTVLVETHVLDDGWLRRREANAPMMRLRRLHATLPKVALWRYYRGGELLGDHTNFFGPNCQAVREAFNSAGFECRLVHTWGDRATFEAVARAGLAEALKAAYEVQIGATAELFQLDQPSPAPGVDPPRAQPRIPPGPTGLLTRAWEKMLRKAPVPLGESA